MKMPPFETVLSVLVQLRYHGFPFLSSGSFPPEDIFPWIFLNLDKARPFRLNPARFYEKQVLKM